MHFPTSSVSRQTLDLKPNLPAAIAARAEKRPLERIELEIPAVARAWRCQTWRSEPKRLDHMVNAVGGLKWRIKIKAG